MEDSSQKSNASRPKLVIPKSVMKEHFKTHPTAPVKGPVKPVLANNFPVFDPSAKSTVSLQAVQGLKLLPQSALSDETSVMSKEDPFISFNNLCKNASQLVFKQMEGLMEILPNMSNVERKQHLISMALKSRELFYKLSILADFLAARSNDVQLIAMRSLRKYDLALVQVADSLALSIGQALNDQTPMYAIADAIDLITCGTCSNRLPSMLLNEFCEAEKVPDELRPIWIRRLDNLIKSNLLNLPASNCKLLGVANGIAEILFHHDVLLRVTLVPIFEDRTVSWYFLSVKMTSKDSLRHLSNTLIAYLQAHYNGIKANGNFYFIHKISSDIGLLKVVYVLNVLKTQFEDLKRTTLDDLELILDDLDCFTVKLWHKSLSSKSLSIRFSAKSSVDIELTCSWNPSMIKRIASDFDVDPNYARNILEEAFRHHSKCVCERFIADLNEAASLVLPLYSQHQVTLFDDDESGYAIRIDMPKEPILLTISAKSGRLRMGRKGQTFPSSINGLLSEGQTLEPFVRFLRQMRNDDIFQELDELLASNPEFVLVDQSIFQIPASLSTNVLVIALRRFQGKYVLLEWASASPKLHLLCDSTTTSSFHPSLFNLSYYFDPSDMSQLVNFDFSRVIKALEIVKKDVILEGLKKDLQMNGIIYEESTGGMSNNAADYILLNIGRPPSIKQVDLILTDDGIVRVEMEILGADLFKFEPYLMDTSGPLVVMAVSEGRFDLALMLSRIRSFASFMIMGTQLGHLGIDYMIYKDHIEFCLSEFGMIQLHHDSRLKRDPSKMQHKLVLPESLLASIGEGAKGFLQDHLSRTCNVSGILDFLERHRLSRAKFVSD